jgi:hypothetical protein
LPEFWDALTGQTRAAAAFTSARGCTSVPVELAADGSLFVVFRAPASVSTASGQNFFASKPIAALVGPWTVKFDSKWGGPEQAVVFEQLADWSKRPEDGIRCFSGTAVYRLEFDAPVGGAAGGRVWLDLGVVKNIAQVRLNGHDLGALWTAPWRVDITSAIKPTANELEIIVANLWVKRLIGDESLPPNQRFTKTNVRPFKKDMPLLESGLLGPVTLQMETKSPAKTGWRSRL